MTVRLKSLLLLVCFLDAHGRPSRDSDVRLLERPVRHLRHDNPRRILQAESTHKYVRMSRRGSIAFSRTYTRQPCIIKVELACQRFKDDIGLSCPPEDFGLGTTTSDWRKELVALYFTKSKSYICVSEDGSVYARKRKRRMNITECIFYQVDAGSPPVVRLYSYQHPADDVQCRRTERETRRRRRRCSRLYLSHNGTHLMTDIDRSRRNKWTLKSVVSDTHRGNKVFNVDLQRHQRQEDGGSLSTTDVPPSTTPRAHQLRHGRRREQKRRQRRQRGRRKQPSTMSDNRQSTT